jgi:hypothetical protein
MKTILTIGHTDYALAGHVTDPDLTKLLSLLRGLREVDMKHTDDYKQSRYVFKERQERIRLALEAETEFAEPGEWEAFNRQYEAGKEKANEA